MRFLATLLCSLTLLACGPSDSTAAKPEGGTARVPEAQSGQEIATFAGGCFWCMVAPFVDLPGVVSVTSGYTGGHVADPTYEQVSAGRTGHAESVQVIFDPAKIGYDRLLQVFWHSIDPTDASGQFCDTGNQYRTAIFYHGEQQHRAAVASRDALARSGVLKAPITTEITEASPFYPAEEYHQDYYRKQEIRYRIYRHACGRDLKLRELYGDGAVVSHPGS